MYEMTRLAMETLDQVPAEWREYNALTVYISRDGFQSIKAWSTITFIPDH